MKQGPNDSCACGSQKKYKKCCGQPSNQGLLPQIGDLIQKRDYHSALQKTLQARSVFPSVSGWHQVLSVCYLNLNNLTDALNHSLECVESDPQNYEGWSCHAGVLSRLNRDAEALKALTKSLELKPDFLEAQANLAAVQVKLNQLQAALPLLQSLSQKIPSASVFQNLGICLHRLNRLDEAENAYMKAVELNPGWGENYQNLSSVLLSQRKFSLGWDFYRVRSSTLARGHFLEARPENLQGLNLVLSRDQGLGDELFFWRFIPSLLKMGLKQIFYKTDSKLAPVLKRLNLVPLIESFPDPDIAISDLPYIIHHQNDSPIPPSLRLEPLHSGPDLSGYPRPLLGLVWRAGSRQDEQIHGANTLNKEIPLAELLSVLEGFKGTPVLLQRGIRPDEIEALRRRFNPIHVPDSEHDDFEAMLALLAQLDDTIEVSNTYVHLQALIGQKARILVPNPPEFRWPGNDFSPWFPEFKTYRQEISGSWSKALNQLKKDLYDTHFYRL